MLIPEMMSELWCILQKQSLDDLHLIIAEALPSIIKHFDNAVGHVAACSNAENQLNIIAIRIIFFTLIICGAQRYIRTVLIFLFAFVGSLLKLHIMHSKFVSSSALFLSSSILCLPDVLSLIQLTLQLISSNTLQPGTEYVSAVSASNYFKGIIIASTLFASSFYDAPWISVPVFLFLLRWSLATISTALTLVIETIWVIRNVYEVLLFSILPILIIRIGAVGLNMPTNGNDFHRTVHSRNCLHSLDRFDLNGQTADKSGIFLLISIFCIAASEAFRRFLITTANRKINHSLSKSIGAFTDHSLKKSESPQGAQIKIIESCIAQISPEDYQRCVKETPWSDFKISSSANTSTETDTIDFENIGIFEDEIVAENFSDNGTIDNESQVHLSVRSPSTTESITGTIKRNQYKAQYEVDDPTTIEVKYLSPLSSTVTTPTIPKMIMETKSSIFHVLRARKLRIRQSGGQYLSYSLCQNLAKSNEMKNFEIDSDSEDPSDDMKLAMYKGKSAEAVSKNVQGKINEGTVPAANNDKSHQNAYYSSTGEMEIDNSPIRPRSPTVSLLSIFSPRHFHHTLPTQASKFFQIGCDGDPLRFTFSPPPPCVLPLCALASLYPSFLKGAIIPANLPEIENIPLREEIDQCRGSLFSNEDDHFTKVSLENISLPLETLLGGPNFTSRRNVPHCQLDLHPDIEPNNCVQSLSPVPSAIILCSKANYCLRNTSQSRFDTSPYENSICRNETKYEKTECLKTENNLSILVCRRIEEEVMVMTPMTSKSTTQSSADLIKLTNISDPDLKDIVELKNVSYLIEQIEGKEVTKLCKQSITSIG